MGNDKKEKKDLKMSDFKFLTAGKLKKLEVRYNSNTSQKLFGKASFQIDNKRDDTEVGVYVTGADYPEIMTKLYDWYENYFKHIKVFGKLSGREKDDDVKSETGTRLTF